MSDQVQKDTAAVLKTAVQDILKTIEQEREREIITRRFGLFDRKETLEQIGNYLVSPVNASVSLKKLS